MVYTPKGVFRRFAFIGYADETSAQHAVDYFNNTYIDSSKIEVNLALTFGDKTLPRPWSKYSEGSSAYKIRNPKRKLEPKTIVEEKGDDKNMEKVQRLNQTHHKSKLTGLLNEYYDLESDPEFLEFLAVHKTQATSKVWSNDNGLEEERASKKRKKEKVKSSLVSVESKKPGGKGLLLTRTHLKFQDDDDKEQGYCYY